MISNKAKKQIDAWVSKYPAGRGSSAVMEALRVVQGENGGVLTPKLQEEVADYLGMPTIAVAEVATFYENYNHKNFGRHTIRFCHNISCMLNGADDLIDYLEDKLEIKFGEVTKDGRIGLKKVECLAGCVGAPMCQIGDKYYENLTKDKLDKILGGLR